MPLFDMPLDQLHAYAGTNPRPADMDPFWEAALDEMRSTDPGVELVRQPFAADFAECHHLYFTGVRGARIHAKYLRPVADRGPHPAVLMFHGYSGDSGDWADKLGYVAQGFSVAALDCRGQGGMSEDTGGVKGNTLNGHIIRGLDQSPADLLFRHIYLDCAQMARIVMEMPEVDADRVGATGGSQGGGLTLACAALEPRIRKAAPVYPFLCDFQRVWEIDLAVAAYDELKQYFRRFDPRHEREADVFTRLGYIDNQHLAGRIRAETLFLVGLMDTVCPPSSQFAAYNKITAPKSLVIYPDFGHEGLPQSGDRIYEFMATL
jgi:cephalosporin-C deacetylase